MDLCSFSGHGGLFACSEKKEAVNLETARSVQSIFLFYHAQNSRQQKLNWNPTKSNCIKYWRKFRKKRKKKRTVKPSFFYVL